MSARRPLPLLATAGALVLLQPGSAQERDDLTIPVGECLAIEDSLERLACYERLVEAARAEDPAAAADADADAADEAATPAEAGDDGFGFRAEAVRPEREPPPEIRSTVAAVEESRPNLLTVTLENGQIWRQMQSQRFNLRAGHHVRIYGTRWGDSYRLAADELYGFIQVERVR